jgi:hypothetical protein
VNTWVYKIRAHSDDDRKAECEPPAPVAIWGRQSADVVCTPRCSTGMAREVLPSPAVGLNRELLNGRPLICAVQQPSRMWRLYSCYPAREGGQVLWWGGCRWVMWRVCLQVMSADNVVSWGLREIGEGFLVGLTYISFIHHNLHQCAPCPAQRQARGQDPGRVPREHTRSGSPTESGPCRRPPESAAACELQNWRPLYIHHRLWKLRLLLLEINAPPLTGHPPSCSCIRLGFGGKTRAIGFVDRLGLDLKDGSWIWLLDRHGPFLFSAVCFFQI